MRNGLTNTIGFLAIKHLFLSRTVCLFNYYWEFLNAMLQLEPWVVVWTAGENEEAADQVGKRWISLKGVSPGNCMNLNNHT